MSDMATTRMSSKGQVVIPEEIRDRLALEPGTQFLVIGEGDAVILKVLQPPAMAEFDDLVKRARKAAKRAGMTKRDIDQAVKTVRDRR
jgi:AbrB family looped-hinge helix DNA binding protein